MRIYRALIEDGGPACGHTPRPSLAGTPGLGSCLWILQWREGGGGPLGTLPDNSLRILPLTYYHFGVQPVPPSPSSLHLLTQPENKVPRPCPTFCKRRKVRVWLALGRGPRVSLSSVCASWGSPLQGLPLPLPLGSQPGSVRGQLAMEGSHLLRGAWDPSRHLWGSNNLRPQRGGRSPWGGGAATGCAGGGAGRYQPRPALPLLASVSPSSLTGPDLPGLSYSVTCCGPQ